MSESTYTAERQRWPTPLIPGRWRPVLRQGEKPGDPMEVIKFACPSCGIEADLSDHEVDANGLVSPSVLCPAECGFHASVTLKGWDNAQ